MMTDKLSRLVPTLRFPAFAQDPGWDHAKIADLVETVTPPKKLNTSAYLFDGRFPIVDQSARYICGWTNDDETIITRPLPVIVFGDHTCVLKFVDQPFAQGADGIKIFTARRCVSTVYLYHQLSHRPVVMEQYKRHFSTLKKKVVCFPDPKSGEQKKIADCLGSLDDLIAAEDRKLNALRRHKQGLMQQLFPRPDETMPRLRFPEFREAGDWKTMKWGDFVSRGKEKFDPRNSGDTPRLIELENIEAKTGRILGLTRLEKQSSLKSWFQAGDVLFGKLRPYLQKFARPDFQGVCTTEIWVLRSKEVSSEFLFYLVQTERFIQLANVSSGSRMPRAEWNILAGANFRIPHSDEQQRIADCLGSLDDLIAAEDRKLNALRRHKRGLMQQLFPSLEDR